MRCIVLIAAMLGIIPLYAQMPVYGADSLMRHYRQKADALMVGHASIRDWFEINLYGIRIYSEPDGEQAKVPVVEYSVTWQELPVYKRMMNNESRSAAMEIMLAKGAQGFAPAVQKAYSKPLTKDGSDEQLPLKPLAGLRIAIDPGHIAGDTAEGRLEQKFIKMNVPVTAGAHDSVAVAFAEGQLTWQTAVLLAERLRQLGAKVMITRKGPGLTAFGKTFLQWKNEDYQRTLDSMLLTDPKNQNLKDLKSGRMKEDRSRFRFVFRDAELRKRADLINGFRPDLTVVIHYNVDETNAPWSRPTTRNFSMLFVPGAFQENELSESEERFDFLRLLLLDDMERSIEVSGKVAAHFRDELKVPLATVADAAYLATSCKRTAAEGVYARNLSMTRLVHGPVVYGETLYQDHFAEALLLGKQSVTDSISQLPASPRVIEVADAYCNGIKAYYTGR